MGGTGRGGLLCLSHDLWSLLQPRSRAWEAAVTRHRTASVWPWWGDHLHVPISGSPPVAVNLVFDVLPSSGGASASVRKEKVLLEALQSVSWRAGVGLKSPRSCRNCCSLLASPREASLASAWSHLLPTRFTDLGQCRQDSLGLVGVLGRASSPFCGSPSFFDGLVRSRSMPVSLRL